MNKFIIIILYFFITNCTLNKVVKHHGVHNLKKKGDKLELLITNSNDVISFGAATIPGDYVECIAISSTVWLVRGACKAATNGIVFADA